MSERELRMFGVGIYMNGILHEFKEQGLIGGGFNVTPKGVAAFDQLRATGFIPSEEERRAYLRDVCKFRDDHLRDAEVLVTAFVEGRFGGEGAYDDS